MQFVNDDGCIKLPLGELETVLQRNVQFLLRECEDGLNVKLTFNEDFIEESSYIKFISWYNKNYEDTVPIKRPAKRSYSTTHRIEIAYKSKYKCNACDILLPPTFEIDHIVELRDGGTDTYDNLQALCPNCHSLKTRANTLKRDKAFEKEFGKRSRVMEENAFQKFKFKRSKYFS